jgi:hypothetical protein
MEQQPVLPRVYSDLIPAPYCTKKHRNQKPTDPKTARASLAGFVWTMRIIFAAGAVVSATVAGGLFME